MTNRPNPKVLVVVAMLTTTIGGYAVVSAAKAATRAKNAMTTKIVRADGHDYTFYSPKKGRGALRHLATCNHQDHYIKRGKR